MPSFYLTAPMQDVADPHGGTGRRSVLWDAFMVQGQDAPRGRNTESHLRNGRADHSIWHVHTDDPDLIRDLRAKGAERLPFDNPRELASDATQRQRREAVDFLADNGITWDRGREFIDNPGSMTWKDWLDAALVDSPQGRDMEKKVARERILHAGDPVDEQRRVREEFPDRADEFSDDKVDEELEKSGRPRPPRPRPRRR